MLVEFSRDWSILSSSDVLDRPMANVCALAGKAPVVLEPSHSFTIRLKRVRIME